MSTLRNMIPTVMECFDFERVHLVMTFLDWKWATMNSGMTVPTIEMLQAEAQRQLDICVTQYEKRGCPKSGMSIASGGFQALVMTFEHGEPRLQLGFYVESCGTATRC